MDSVRSTRLLAGGRALGYGTLVAGTLDISFVLIFYGCKGVSPERLLQGIAVSVLGRPAYQGGWAAAILVLVLHFGVAFGAAALFYLFSRRLRFLVLHPLYGGLIFGAFFYLLMNTVVLRFTLLPVGAFPPANWPVILPPHLFCVGLPLAYITRRFAP